MEQLRQENEAIRLQLQSVERQRMRLEAILSGKQQEHRLVLQKVKSLLEKDVLRYAGASPQPELSSNSHAACYASKVYWCVVGNS